MQIKVTILGINGGFGRLFSTLMHTDTQLSITGVDLANEIDPLSKGSIYIQSNLALFDEKVGSVVRESDYIIICLPEAIAYIFFDWYGAQISTLTLVVDTLSVKRSIASIYNKNNFNALSLNPMFGPDLKITGKNIVVVKFNESREADNFTSLLETWKLNLVYLTAEEHDKITSMVQAATHAAIMAFGITLKDFDIPLTDILKVATPPFSMMSALFGRIISGHKKVYWNIQNENSYASGSRKGLIENLISLDQSIDGNHEQEFNELIEPKNIQQKEFFIQLSKRFLDF